LVSKRIQTRERLITFLKGSKPNIYNQSLSHVPKPKQNRVKPEFYSSLQLLYSLTSSRGLWLSKQSETSPTVYIRTGTLQQLKDIMGPWFSQLLIHKKKKVSQYLQLLTLVWWLKWRY